MGDTTNYSYAYLYADSIFARSFMTYKTNLCPSSGIHRNMSSCGTRYHPWCSNTAKAYHWSRSHLDTPSRLQVYPVGV